MAFTTDIYGQDNDRGSPETVGEGLHTLSGTAPELLVEFITNLAQTYCCTMMVIALLTHSEKVLGSIVTASRAGPLSVEFASASIKE